MLSPKRRIKGNSSMQDCLYLQNISVKNGYIAIKILYKGFFCKKEKSCSGLVELILSATRCTPRHSLLQWRGQDYPGIRNVAKKNCTPLSEHMIGQSPLSEHLRWQWLLSVIKIGHYRPHYITEKHFSAQIVFLFICHQFDCKSTITKIRNSGKNLLTFNAR